MGAGTPLHWAARGGALEAFGPLLEAGASLVKLDSADCSAVAWAAEAGHVHVLHFLMYVDANLNLVLQKATKGGHTSLVEWLLDAGVNVDGLTGKFGKHTALDVAAYLGYLPIVKLLLNRGARFDVYGGAYTSMTSAALGGHVDVIRVLLDWGADMNDVDKEGRIPLTSATEFGHMHAVEYLLECGAYVNSRDRSGMTALMHAAGGSCSETILRYLLAKNADVNCRDRSGVTALMLASGGGLMEVLKHVGDRADDLNCRMVYGGTAIGEARVSLRTRRGGRMVSVPARCTFQTYKNGKAEPVPLASQRYDDYNVNLLLDAGADINARDVRGRTSLHYAAGYKNNIKVIRTLIARGADPNAFDCSGMTVLHHAAATVRFNTANISALIDGGANVLSTDNASRTALHYAATVYGNCSVINLLLNKQADPNIKDRDGKTALHYASVLGLNDAVTNALISRGADPSIRGGRRPIALKFYQVSY